MKLTPGHWEAFRRSMREEWGREISYPTVCPMFRDWHPEDLYPEEDTRIPSTPGLEHEMTVCWRRLDSRQPECAYAILVYLSLRRLPKGWNRSDSNDYAEFGMLWIEAEMDSVVSALTSGTDG